MRWLFLANAAIAVLIAGAFDASIKAEAQKAVRRVGKIFFGIGIVALCISVTLLIVNVLASESIISSLHAYFDAHMYAQTSGLPLEHYHDRISGMWRELVLDFSLLSPRFLFALIGVFLTGWWFWRRKITERALVALIIISILPLLFFYHPKEGRSHIADIAEMYASAHLNDQGYVMPVMPGLADFSVRTTQFGDTPEERLRYQLALLLPNRHSLINVRSLDFYQPIQPSRMGRLLAAIGSEVAPAPQEERVAFAQGSIEDRIDSILRRSCHTPWPEGGPAGGRSQGSARHEV